jgi:hypothetical protein
MPISDFSHLARMIEIAREDIVAATGSRAECRAFLERTAAIARPQNGGPLLLLLFSRMATLACEWLDGDLRIELVAQGEDTLVDVQLTVGFGGAERVFPRSTFHVPLSEFRGAIERVPQMIWPLSVTQGSKRMLLRASSEVRTSTLPPSIEIDVACQSQTIPKAAPLPMPADPSAVIVFGGPQEPGEAREERSVVTKRLTLPYGCRAKTGT